MKVPEDIQAQALCNWYTPKAGYYDEMRSEQGLRPHWEYFIASLNSLGCDELERRRIEAQRLLRENGVTYNVYGDPQGLNRPWELDPIPLLISSEEWARIESGLIQRAEVMNLILEDLYGARNLLKKGLLPLELIFSHRGFLRPCDQIKLAGQHQLITYAADLTRGPDGQMWVLGDRTQAPSGAGYALENRMAMSRMLPSLFRDSHVHRLALFFRSLRTSLTAVAPQNNEDPHVVLLTPGPRNETYFEHAYLAAYLGYTLVQGDDLVVRDGQVWLKSLGGLRPVDVILRRVDDHYCDPLELQADSQLGVPGLLQAVRMGKVAIANSLGSSILENPGLMAFLPRICKYFLGQDLRIPSVATWWCGHPKERGYVLKNIHKLVIRPIYRHPASQPAFGSMLNKKELESLKARIKAHPHNFMGQELVSVSTAPTFVNGRLEPRHTILRSFLTARTDSYEVMPGGLTRTAFEKGSFIVSNQTGAVSKDTWVLASEPEKQVTLWLEPPREAVVIVESGNFPSRALENLFWVGRYAERAEAITRLLRTVLIVLNETREFSSTTENKSLQTLLSACTYLTAMYPGFIETDSEQLLLNPEEELLSIIFDAQQSGSLLSSLRLMVQAAYTVRDRWSTDTWRVIDQIDKAWRVSSSEQPLTIPQVQHKLDQLITSLVAFTGLNMENMTRAPGWVFLDMGRRMERGFMLTSLLRATLVTQQNDVTAHQLLESVLATSECLITYRRRYRDYLESKFVLDLLLLDDTNPRSLIYQLERLQQHIESLPREKIIAQLYDEQRLILEAVTQLRLSETTALITKKGDSPVLEALDQQLTRMSYLLGRLSEVITQTYFSHEYAPQQLTPYQPEP